MPNAELPEVPELNEYHAATRRASQLSAAGRAAVTDFLSTVTAQAAAATSELQNRTVARPRAAAASSARQR